LRRLSSALLNARAQPAGITRARLGTSLAIEPDMLKLKTTKKLSIKSESLRRLSEQELAGANGAGRAVSYWCSTQALDKCGYSVNALYNCL